MEAVPLKPVAASQKKSPASANFTLTNVILFLAFVWFIWKVSRFMVFKEVFAKNPGLPALAATI